MAFRGTITLDYSVEDNNDYQRLLNALHQCGWDYAETSAMFIDCDDLLPIQLAFEVLARALPGPGQLSAINVNVQLLCEPRDPPAIGNHNKARANMLKRKLPSALLKDQ